MHFQKRWLFVLFMILFPVWSGFSVPVQIEAAGQLLITEVYYDTPGEDIREEWVEIANVGTAVIDLSDIKVGDEEKAGGGEGMKRFPAGAHMGPGEVVIVAQTAVGFRALFGFNPHFEITESDDAVPNMRNFPLWAHGDMALANDGDEVLLVAGTAVIDALNYGDSAHYFAPSIVPVARGQSIERHPANCDTDTAADWQPARDPSPGVIAPDEMCVTVNPAALEALPVIGDIQGTTDISPLVNEEVSFRGVVTGMLADRNTRGITFYTLFVQDKPGTEDGDPATSDGIALFLGRERPSFHIGDQVRVSGQVTEFFGFTEIDDDQLQIWVEGEGIPLPEPVSLGLPADDDHLVVNFETLESMRVSVPDTVQVVGPTYSGCGLTVAKTTGPVFQRDESGPSGFVLPVIHTSDSDCTGFPQLKSGDQISNLTGPLIYQFDQYKLVQQSAVDLTVTEAHWPDVPEHFPVHDNQISVASFNFDNYFDAVDDTGDDAEPKSSAADMAIRQQKLVVLIPQVLGCPTLLGTQEVEHAALLDDLAEALVMPCGFRYTVTHLESVDVRGIDVALLSDPRRVTVFAAALRQSCTGIDTAIEDATIDCPANQHPLFSRPPLQIDVMVDERPLTAIVNHFKSKRGGADETAARRLAQAEHVNQLVATLLAAEPEANIIVMGDFNDFELSAPMQAMTVNGYLTNSLLRIPDDSRYSYVFGGVSQLIDGILLSSSLVERVQGVTIQHVNADFPVGIAGDTSPDSVAFRVSDHDIPLLLLDWGDKLSPVVETAVFPTPTRDSPPIDTPVAVADDSATYRSWITLGIGFGFLALLIIFAVKQRQ